MKHPARIPIALAPILVAACLNPVLCRAEEKTFPPPGWQDQPDPVAYPYAETGGKIVDYAGQSPKSLNYYLDNNTMTARLFSSMYETLIEMDPMTLEYEPAIAQTWSIAEDKKTFTFHIDPGARWSDGKPITSRDVKWTYSAVMDPSNMTGSHKVSLGRLFPPEIVDERTVIFKAREVHWQNLGAAGGFEILPRHAFGSLDFNKVNFEFPVVSGPYRLDEIREGIYLDLDRRSNWWRRDRPSSRGIFNFETVRYKFFADRTNAFEAFMKGDIDVFPIYTARLWVKETRGEKIRKNWIVRQKIYNRHPVGFQGFAMNMRREPFDDVRVRKAIAHLVDREKMNSTLMYDQYFLHRSYYEDLYSENHPCPNEPVQFDKDRARELLKQAGWRANPETGILEKNRTPFRFKFLTRSPSSDKFLALFMEDVKDVGIELEIERRDWAAWAKDMDEFNYDMTWAAWGAGLFKDPEGMWSSAEAERKGGNNITGYRNPEVDRLIEEQKTIFDVTKRHEICRKIDQLVFAEHPYALLWNIDYVRLLYWNKVGTPDTVLSKYGTESTAYWWWDKAAAAELKQATKTGASLPRKPGEVYFNDSFPGGEPGRPSATEAAIPEKTGESAPARIPPGRKNSRGAEPRKGPTFALIILGIAMAMAAGAGIRRLLQKPGSEKP